MISYQRNIIVLALKSLGKAIDEREVDNYINTKGKKFKKPETIFSKAVAHFGLRQKE